MIGIVNYDMGNIQSVKNACEALGKEAMLCGKPEEIFEVSHLILPGVGAFPEGMNNLKSRNLIPAIKEAVFNRNLPILGICLGMQLLADLGTEGGDHPGLGFIPGKVLRFNDSLVRVPHVGWNNLEVIRENPLLPMSSELDFYFVHSYFFDVINVDDVVATCDYGIKFPCAVKRKNILGVQFHPEKSHNFGLELLRNFFKYQGN